MNSDNYMVLVKYRRSILVDQVLALVPEILFIACYSQLNRFSVDFKMFLFFCAGILSISFYLLSDVIFFNRSLGKRVYRVGVVYQNFNNYKTSIYSTVYRRILEVTIHPRVSGSFLAKSQIIDKLTKTHIEEYH